MVFPVDGYVVAADCFGRNIEDAVIYDGIRAYVFSGKTLDNVAPPRGPALRQLKKLSASTLYPGGEYQ